MKTAIVSACAALCVLTAAAAGRAQDIAVLKAIPSNADGFVVIKNVGQFDKKYETLRKRVEFQGPGFLEFLAPSLGVDKGLDRNGQAGVIIYAPLEDRKELLGVAPIAKFQTVLEETGAKEEEDGLYHYQTPARGLNMAFFKKGDFVIFSDDTEHGRKYLLHAMQHKESVAGQIKDVQPWLASQDVAAVMLPSAAKTLAKFARQQIPDEFPGVPEDQEKLLRTQFDWLRGLAKSVGEEVNYAAIGGKLDGDDNMTVSLQAGYREGGRFAQMAGAAKHQPLAGLPGGPFIMAIGAGVSPEMMRSFMKFGAEASKSTNKLSDAEAKELLKAATDSLEGVESASFVMRSTKDKEPTFSGMVAVLKVADAKSYLKVYGEATQRSNKIMKVSTTLTSVRLGDFPAIEMITDIKTALKDKDKDDPALPITEHLIEQWFGGDKVSVSLVAVDAKTVLMGYVPVGKMKKLADEYVTQKALTADPGTAKTLKMLPENPSVVALVNPRELAQMTVRTMKDLGQPAPIPEIGATPPIGLGARATTTTLDIRLAVPVEILDEIGRQVKARRN